MAVIFSQDQSGRLSSEPIIPQGRIEKAYPGGWAAPSEDGCTERLRLSDQAARPAGDGFPLKRGIICGALAEQELDRFGGGKGFSS